MMYEAIYDDLRQQIASGALSVDDRLPSEPELAMEYGVSRMTVRHAVDRLVREHLVVRRPGSGTYVANARPRYRRVNRLGSLQVEIGQGDTEVGTVVHVQASLAPPPEVRQVLGLPPGQQAVHLVRVRLVDATPAAVQESWVPNRCAPGLARTPLVGGSLYRTLGEVFHIELDWAEQKVTAVAASGEWASWLEVAGGAPVIAITRWTYTKRQELVEYATSWTHPDFPLYIRLDS
jgi:GntR family transcriptional regulator